MRTDRSAVVIAVDDVAHVPVLQPARILKYAAQQILSFPHHGQRDILQSSSVMTYKHS